MRRFIKILFIGIIAVVVVGYLLLITPFTQRAIKDYVLNRITANTSSILKIGSIRGDFSRHLALENVEFKIPGFMLTARRINIKYHPNVLMWGHLFIEDLIIDGAKIKIYPIAESTEKRRDEDSGRKDQWLKDIQINKFNLNTAEIEYVRKKMPPVLFTNINIDAALLYDFINGAMKLDLAGLSCDSESAVTVVKSKGEIISTPNDLRVSGFQIKLPSSTLSLDGAVKDFQSPKIYLHCKSNRFNLGDIPA